MTGITRPDRLHVALGLCLAVLLAAPALAWGYGGGGGGVSDPSMGVFEEKTPPVPEDLPQISEPDQTPDEDRPTRRRPPEDVDQPPSTVDWIFEPDLNETFWGVIEDEEGTIYGVTIAVPSQSVVYVYTLTQDPWTGVYGGRFHQDLGAMVGIGDEEVMSPSAMRETLAAKCPWLGAQ